MKYYLLLTAIILSLLAGCSDNNTKAVDEMLDDFGLSIPNGHHVFVLIPHHSCTGCVKKTWDFLERQEINGNNITILNAYMKGKDPFEKPIGCPVYVDSTFIIENGAISFANPTLIHTNRNKVTKIIELPSNEIEHLLQIELSDYLTK